MENLKQILAKYNLSLKKAFGQNFLSDEELLKDIVEKAGVTKDDIVMEIGCGAGALTRHLASKAKKVVGYEIDTRLKPILSDMLAEYNNVEIVFSDVMKVSLEQIEKKLGGEYILVANLPYYITTPIIMRFLENAKNIKGMVIMVQEEVAYRLASKNSTSDYGAITVAINLRGDAEVIINVGREKFTPPPNVDSAVVKITIDKNKFVGVDLKRVRDVVRIAFSSRRKMLVNNLMNGYRMDRQKAEQVLTEAGLPLTIRGENLSAEDFVNLSQVINQKD